MITYKLECLLHYLSRIPVQKKSRKYTLL